MDAGETRADEEARAAQTEQLLQTIDRESKGRAVIAAGDTNVRPANNPILARLMAKAELADACAELDCPDRDCIDRVLYRSSRDVELKVLRFRIADEFVDHSGRALSDHEAVSVRFSWSRQVPPANPGD
jgi:endonuclease/exonuclease/phosphatase family metal-dependent hydrolase